GLSQPNASRHLRILREAGLVEPRAEGQRRIYELRPAGLAELIGWVAPYQRLWQGSLDALDAPLAPAEMFAWHPPPAAFEPRVGGRVVWDPEGHVADIPESEVTAWDPPRL